MDIKRNDGFTLIELLLVMVLMGILGTICISLLNGGNVFYKGIREDYDGQSEARIAMAYLTTKLRENDVEGAIDLEKRINNKIKIKNSSGSVIYEIYFEDNKLKEERKDISNSEVVEIAKIDSFAVEREPENNNIKITVGYVGKSNKKNIFEQVILLKCGLKRKS